MQFYNRTDTPNGQRSTVPSFPSYDELVAYDKLVAKCQFLFLRPLGVKEVGCADGIGWCMAPLTWPAVRDFDRGGLSLFYKTGDGDWRRVCIDDFTVKPIKLLIALRDVTATVRQGKRSDVIFRIGMTLAQAGASAGEIFHILSKSKCGQAKYGNVKHRLKAEVERIMSKAGRSHGH
jgi:hypothetical protein